MFMAVRQLSSGAMCHVGRKMYVVVATVWVTGFFPTLPHALIADVNIGHCNEVLLKT
jgi:hypothetical protein